MYIEDQICNMIDFLADNISVKVWRMSILSCYWSAMGTICALLLVDLFLYSYSKNPYRRSQKLRTFEAEIFCYAQSKQ